MALKQSLLLGRVVAALVLVLATKVATSQSQIITKPGCLDRCGSVSIPYPFGTSHGDKCYLDDSFLVVCNDSYYDRPLLYLPNIFSNVDVAIINISLPDGELQVSSPISRDCYDKHGNRTTTDYDEFSFFYIMLSSSTLSLSSRRNKFTVVGCDNNAIHEGSRTNEGNYSTSCSTRCDKKNEVKNGSCNGVGCCQISIPEGVVGYFTHSRSSYNHTKVQNFNPCGYCFVADDTYYFSSSDLANLQNRVTVPVALDWSVGIETCETAKENVSAYECRATHSDCVNTTNGGYRCKCSEGFDGNPYLLDGCQDVDECKSTKPCTDIATCHNSDGSFECICPKGYEGDGKRNINGTAGCNRKDRRDQTSLKLGISLGICIGLLLLLVGGSWMYWGLQSRKLMKLKEKFFQQNGGLLLQQQLADQYRGSVESARVFSEEELKRATKNYDENMILGQGGYGTVYKGVLADNKVVAIKKSKIGDQSQIEQFINEVIVLSQINHRNVVKLIGCCLETEVPLLVYEFITNGTLSDHIHNKHHLYNSSLSWEMRLKIATETASALSYLHSSASMPIIHRDIKTANILLDDNYTAKVADFGASRLVPIDQTQLTTLVQGTMGYLDPEYFHTGQLTEKSDVYSFGIVLAELLTGEKALCPDRRDCDRNLAMYFVSSMKEDRLFQILDRQIIRLVGDDHHERNSRSIIQQLKVAANLVKRCVAVRGEDRPTMKEVATELEGLSKEMHSWTQDENDLIPSEETEYLLKPSNDHQYMGEDDHGATTTTSNTTTAAFDSMKVQILTPYGDGR